VNWAFGSGARQVGVVFGRWGTELAGVVTDDERHANYIVPSVFHPDLSSTVAAAVSAAVSSASE